MTQSILSIVEPSNLNVFNEHVSGLIFAVHKGQFSSGYFWVTHYFCFPTVTSEEKPEEPNLFLTRAELQASDGMWSGYC